MSRVRTVAGAGVVALGLLFLAARTDGAQAPPSTDIFVADLDLGAAAADLTNLRNLTDRDGYDNQPSFEPTGNALLYTSGRDGQTDIFRIDLGTLQSEQITHTAESEYSPTVMPNGNEFSVIRVEADGAQRLWAFRRDGSEPRLLLETVAPVGYHAWGERGQVVLFVLGEPATLQLASLETGTAETLAADIGRSLHRLPEGTGFSFLHRIDEHLRIQRFDDETGAISDLGEPIEGSQDMTWTADGRILMAAGARVYIRRPEQAWRLVADLSEHGVAGITRLAVNSTGDKLALVAEHR